jgi:FkbM family methyltransferase
LAATAPTPNVRVFAQAVSDETGQIAPFYVSDVSTGISGLSAFHESHVASGVAETTRLDDFMRLHRITSVDFLKIDVEGYELRVLQGFDLGRHRPRALVVEFEDHKTMPLGYETSDLLRTLVDAGYVVYVSEWHPIERYGVQHSWKRLSRYPCDVPTQSWGNLIAFREEPPPSLIRQATVAALVSGPNRSRWDRLLAKVRRRVG